VNVAIDEQGMGTASPRGTLTGIKQDIPFTLNYSSFSEYGFLGWEAVLESAQGTKLNANKVEFVPADKPETTVTVKLNPGADRVIIRPVGGLAPTVVSFTPDVANGMADLGQVIRIRFSRAIDPASFLFDDVPVPVPFKGDWKAVYYPEIYGDPDSYAGYDEDRDYKNILIETDDPLSISTTDSNNWAPFYYPPELSLDGTILTIAPRRGIKDLDFTGRHQFTVTLDRDIKDTGGISMGRTTSFRIETESRWFRDSPTGDPPYLQVLLSGLVMVKAFFDEDDADHPDGRIFEGAKIFKDGGNTDYNVWPYGPSSEPTHHFDYGSDDNWIYIAFQTELNDYTFNGALVYEETGSSGSEKYSYTGQTAKPVYDPAIVKPLTDHFKTVYTKGDVFTSGFDPSRPIRVVRYNLSKRTGTGNSQVSLYIIPLDVLDKPCENDEYSSYAKTDVATLKQDELFTNGSNSIDFSGRDNYALISVWFTGN
jgi:hypothetical protein